MSGEQKNHSDWILLKPSLHRLWSYGASLLCVVWYLFTQHIRSDPNNLPPAVCLTIKPRHAYDIASANSCGIDDNVNVELVQCEYSAAWTNAGGYTENVSCLTFHLIVSHCLSALMRWRYNTGLQLNTDVSSNNNFKVTQRGTYRECNDTPWCPQPLYIPQCSKQATYTVMHCAQWNHYVGQRSRLMRG